MGKIRTQIDGITTSSSYKDGDCYSLVNLRKKNGALHPVSPRKVVQELSREYDIVFVHRNNDYENWIGVVNDSDGATVYWDILKSITEEYHIYGKRINLIEQIGNTVSLIMDDTIFYMLYRDNKYDILGEIPELPAISIKSIPMEPITVKYSEEYGPGVIKKADVLNATKGLVYKIQERIVLEQGAQFFDACFVRYAFRLFDGSLVKHSPPILIMPEEDILNLKRFKYELSGDVVSDEHGYVTVKGFKIALIYNIYISSKWEDIIQSVDLFVSAPVGISNVENLKVIPVFGQYREIPIIASISSENINAVKNISTYYWGRSIKIGEMSPSVNPTIFPDKEKDSSLYDIQNLIYQEVMPEDNFSSHKMGAKCSYSFNGRLHLGNIKTTLFDGFSYDYFEWAGDLYNGKGGGTNNIISVIIEVDIQTGLFSGKVVKKYSRASGKYLFYSAFLSYPDARAKRMTIYYEYYDNLETKLSKVLSVDLESHRLLNIAYYLNEGLKPISPIINNTIVEKPVSKNISYIDSNKTKVSEVNNPFLFPNKNTYLIGDGDILAMATNSMNVADRNYGQFPLYVFNTQGVWTLNLGNGEVLYSSQTAPTYMEAPTTNIVCSTPFGVVFTSKRGLMLINGQSVGFISPQLEEMPLPLKLDFPEGVIKPDLSFVSLKEYISNLSGMVYNPHESEVILYRSDLDFNYVFSLESKSFYISTEKIRTEVKNIFPKLIVAEDLILKDYEKKGSDEINICLITRPIHFEHSGIKRLERLIQRGIVFNKSTTFMTQGSNDGINFKVIKGRTLHERNYKDIDFGLLVSKFDNFVFYMHGVIKSESRIYSLDSIVYNEFDNTKMR